MNNADKQYQDLLLKILNNGTKKSDRTGTGTISIFGESMRFKMSEGFPILTTKKMAFKSIVTELLWFLSGSSNIRPLLQNKNYIWVGDAYKNYETKWKKYYNTIPLTKEEFIVNILNDNKFSNQWGDLGHVYGVSWRKWNTNTIDKNGNNITIDQISKVITQLKTNPDSRRIMVDAWKVDEIENVILPPCHYGFQLYTRELTESDKNEYRNKGIDEKLIPKRYLSLLWNQRSVDTALGLGFNITSYALLLEIMAKICNYVPDELKCSLGDTHIYLNHIEGVEDQISRYPRDLPTLELNGEFNNIDKYWDDNSFKLDDFLSTISYNDFKLNNYNPHDQIQFILSN